MWGSPVKRVAAQRPGMHKPDVIARCCGDCAVCYAALRGEDIRQQGHNCDQHQHPAPTVRSALMASTLVHAQFLVTEY